MSHMRRKNYVPKMHLLFSKMLEFIYGSSYELH